MALAVTLTGVTATGWRTGGRIWKYMGSGWLDAIGCEGVNAGLFASPLAYKYLLMDKVMPKLVPGAAHLFKPVLEYCAYMECDMSQ